MDAENVKDELNNLGSLEKAVHLSRFFKIGSGQYGEGDEFIGVRVPEQRCIAKHYKALPIEEIAKLLASRIHEHRLTGLLILVERFSGSKEAVIRREIVDFYLANLKQVNNWDLVDLSAPKILGEHFLHHADERIKLFSMVKSANLWERRIAILATWPMIKQKRFDELEALAEILLTDTHDLIHKAVGWMLREAGKIDLSILEKFLDNHVGSMPRTMLRYAIEKLEPERRRYFMSC
jgi:3-methyladenine DNA glycosylase AlkD